MTQKTLRARLVPLLLLCLWLWALPAVGMQCQDGELRRISRDVEKCCPKCILRAGGNNLCQGIEDHDCKCPSGHRCAEDSCLFCTKVPECAEGEELVRSGKIHYEFRCKPCEVGTYSSVKNGWCQNWTDCESSARVTVLQGNSTHDSRCGDPPNDVEQAVIAPSSLPTTILAILTAVAVFVLILLTFLLHFCIWTLKDKYFSADDVDHHSPRPPPLPPLPPHADDTSSIQFPEEEHGDKAPEEKLSMLSLRVYNEIS
ncbi:tumor necrosis factor receptor superfamily member 18 isoform X2 [Pithys albifrons albifrons]|uniref:tumor necrosis factor receptor superfamily member 18 isoform X2 n=1 Tax=Pithys albifrons albifrons TaxID=3385563 RepID=UPI003A5CF34E